MVSFEKEIYGTTDGIYVYYITNDDSDLKDICEELSMIVRDEKACRDQKICDTCTSTPHSSDPSKNCRWVKSCGVGSAGRNCEHCVATCSGT
jgi:hypothetical protein